MLVAGCGPGFCCLTLLSSLHLHPFALHVQGFKGLLSAGAGKSKEYMAQKLAKSKLPFFR